MSWANVFTTIENILRLINLIGPLIDFIEIIFKKAFPGEKKGEEKKALAMEWGRVIKGSEWTDEELSGIIEAEVAEKNKSGEFTHSF